MAEPEVTVIQTETETIYEYTTPRAHVRVHKPVLSEEEYAKRLKEAQKALERFYKNVVSSGLDWDECVRRGEKAEEERKKALGY